MIIYLSGPITGTSDYIQRFADAVFQATELFPEAEILNPVEFCQAADFVFASLPKLPDLLPIMRR